MAKISKYSFYFLLNTKGPNKVQTASLDQWSKALQWNDTQALTGTAPFSSSAKLAFADFIGTLGLINFEWGVYCQTTGFILLLINDWCPLGGENQMNAGIETGLILPDWQGHW